MPSIQNRRTLTATLDGQPSVLIVGGEAAMELATILDETAPVRFVSDDEKHAGQAARVGLDARTVDVTDAGSLCRVAEDVDAAVVDFEPDRTALLTAQLLATSCGVDDVLACISNETYRDAFEASDIRFLDGSSLLAGAVREELLLPEPGD